LNSQPHLKHAATLPCDLSFITIHVSDYRFSQNLIFPKIA